MEELLRTCDLVNTRKRRGALNISRSAFLKGVNEGYFPQPIRLGERLPVWRRSDIEAFLAMGGIQKEVRNDWKQAETAGDAS